MSDNDWRRLALQFDGHRMQAIAHLKCMLQDPQAHREAAEQFLSAGPLSGEEVLAERIKALAAPLAAQERDLDAETEAFASWWGEPDDRSAMVQYWAQQAWLERAQK